MYAPAVAQWYTPGGNVASFAYREDTNDWNTLSATMGDEYALPRNMTGTALDVGGYLGSVGIGLALDNPELRVVIVEPVPPNADLIAENIERNGVSERVTLIRGAVGKDGEQVDVWYGYRGNESALHHAFVGNSSIAYDNGGELEHETVTYTALGLASFGALDFLKIDCEGGEWAFLAGGADVGMIVGEAHAVRGHKGRDIIGLLPDHDVSLTGDTEGTCEFRAVRR